LHAAALKVGFDLLWTVTNGMPDFQVAAANAQQSVTANARDGTPGYF
jgi:hypothetical protein